MQNEIEEAHRKTISASNAYRIFGKNPLLLDTTLSIGARAYIESMLKVPTGDRVITPAMQWGIDNEPMAIAALEDELGVKIDYTGENQRRFFHGDFISALPDGCIMHGDNVYMTVEVKCLNTENHELAINSTKDLKSHDWAKYCQVQTQMLCAGAEKGVLAYYDDRHTTALHTVEVLVDNAWRVNFLERVVAAKKYYSMLDEQCVDVINLPMVELDSSDVMKYYTKPRDLVELIRKRAGYTVFDMTTANGRAACKTYSASLIKCIAPAEKISKIISAGARKVIQDDLFFRKTFEAGIREIAASVRKPLDEWELEQSRIEFELVNQIRIESEAAEHKKALIEAHEIALLENELFDLRNEKAARDKQLKTDKDLNHVESVNSSIINKLVKLGVTIDTAKTIVEKAASGELGNLVIQY